MHGAAKYDSAADHLDYVNPSASRGGTLRQAAIGAFDSLNPFAIKGNPAQGLSFYYDRLMARVWDEPFTMYPLIAQSVDVPQDRSSITFHINPRARFQDGSPITADDVVFSYEILRDQGRPNMRRIYKLVNKTEKMDDLIVKFSFGPGYDRESVMILSLMPVLSKKWWSGRAFDSASLDAPVSSGPYKIAEVQPGRRIVYERDPDYWARDLFANKGQYNFDRLVFDYYRDDTVALEAFKAGNLDLRREWDAGKWASNYDFPALKRGDVVKEALPHGRPERVRALIFNTRRAPFDDIRVRRALNEVLDFKWINENLYHGQYKRITSYYPNSELAATGAPTPAELAVLDPWKKDLPPEAFGPAWQPPPTGTQGDMRANLRRADELLKQAGWIVKDGKRVKGGDEAHVFTFEILLGAPEDEKIAMSFINNLRHLGIAASVRVLDNAAYIRRLNNYDYDMTLYFWLSTLSPGSEQVLYWGCAAAKEPARWNYAGVCTPAIDALSQAIADATDREDLVAHVRALDRILTHGYYMIPLYYSGVDLVAYRRFVRHPSKMPLYGMVLESWWAESGE